jgi:hypothetical protein
MPRGVLIKQIKTKLRPRPDRLAYEMGEKEKKKPKMTIF